LEKNAELEGEGLKENMEFLIKKALSKIPYSFPNLL